jgi:hypothetical protein
MFPVGSDTFHTLHKQILVRPLWTSCSLDTVKVRLSGNTSIDKVALAAYFRRAHYNSLMALAAYFRRAHYNSPMALAAYFCR